MDENNKGINFGGLKSKFRLFFHQEYFRNHIVAWLIIASFIANLASWLTIKIFLKPVDFPIILHYNVYFGVDMVGDWRQTYWLPIIGLALFLVNLFLALHFYRQKERIASYLLLIGALMIQLSLVVASVSIIIINY